MEYRLFRIINKRTPKNNYIRIIISNTFLGIGTILFIIPLPFSAIGGLSIIVMGLIVKIKNPQNIKYLIKIRKSIIYLFKNLKKKKTIKQKFKDIKKLYRKL